MRHLYETHTELKSFFVTVHILPGSHSSHRHRSLFYEEAWSSMVDRQDFAWTGGVRVCYISVISPQDVSKSSLGGIHRKESMPYLNSSVNDIRPFCPIRLKGSTIEGPTKSVDSSHLRSPTADFHRALRHPVERPSRPTRGRGTGEWGDRLVVAGVADILYKYIIPVAISPMKWEGSGPV